LIEAVREFVQKVYSDVGKDSEKPFVMRYVTLSKKYKLDEEAFNAFCDALREFWGSSVVLVLSASEVDRLKSDYLFDHSAKSHELLVAFNDQGITPHLVGFYSSNPGERKIRLRDLSDFAVRIVGLSELAYKNIISVLGLDNKSDGQKKEFVKDAVHIDASVSAPVQASEPVMPACSSPSGEFKVGTPAFQGRRGAKRAGKSALDKYGDSKPEAVFSKNKRTFRRPLDDESISAPVQASEAVMPARPGHSVVAVAGSPLQQPRGVASAGKHVGSQLHLIFTEGTKDPAVIYQPVDPQNVATCTGYAV